jgi:rhamnogalacturonan endolyase
MKEEHLLICSVVLFSLLALYCLTPSSFTLYNTPPVVDRQLVAVHTAAGVFLSWQLLGSDPPHLPFNLYRHINPHHSSTDSSHHEANYALVNREGPITAGTNYLDPDGTLGAIYTVVALATDEHAETTVSRPAWVWRREYLEVRLDRPPDGKAPGGGGGEEACAYRADDASLGDLDGDGTLELVLKWDPNNSRDNAYTGLTCSVIIDAYRLVGSGGGGNGGGGAGARLWRIDLGVNVRAGAHYTQFMVWDLDGDGRAEVAMKTGDGTVDGTGRVIGEAGADHRDWESGMVTKGPEYLTVFAGDTGAALVTTEFSPARGRMMDWGDDQGNRVDRFLAGVAYLDGRLAPPSLIMTRGYYIKTALAAFDFRPGGGGGGHPPTLTRRWLFDSDQQANRTMWVGQGNHQLNVADVVVFGAMVVDHDGRGLYSTLWGHGDALHTTDVDPARPGLETCQVHEKEISPYTLTCRDAATGRLLWGLPYVGLDSGRCVVADVDPRHPGQEVWARDVPGLYTAAGEKITDTTPSMHTFGIWWDGDLLRELLDNITISKWDWAESRMVPLLTATGAAVNTMKGVPCLQADLLGDWREEVVWRTEDSSALRIYTTTHPTRHRLVTLLHDHNYRLSVAGQNVAYNQMPHPSFFLGEGMAMPP